jgi:rhodanese-related sulfurtransferase
MEEVVMEDASRITAEELKRRMEASEEFTFIDTRNPTAWAEAETRIPGALRITADTLEENLTKISKDKPIVTYCT